MPGADDSAHGGNVFFLTAEFKMHTTSRTSTLFRAHNGILNIYGAFFTQGIVFCYHIPHHKGRLIFV